MNGRADLPCKLTGETKTYPFDFSSEIGSGVTLSSPVVTAAVYSGTDASPASIISGSASASGAIVSQKITAGVTGVIYELTCQVATSDGQTLQQVGLIAVVPKAP